MTTPRLPANRPRATGSGLTPLDYLLQIVRDPKASTARRDKMAKAALPYCHERLADKQIGKKARFAEQEAKQASAAWNDALDLNGPLAAVMHARGRRHRWLASIMAELAALRTEIATSMPWLVRTAASRIDEY